MLLDNKKYNKINFHKKKKFVPMLLWIKHFKYFWPRDEGWSSFYRFARKKPLRITLVFIHAFFMTFPLNHLYEIH